MKYIVDKYLNILTPGYVLKVVDFKKGTLTSVGGYSEIEPKKQL